MAPDENPPHPLIGKTARWSTKMASADCLEVVEHNAACVLD
jgi:hypothetical protein